MKLPLRKQNISSCSAPVFNGTFTTADPNTVKATASISADTLVYSPGSTMPVLTNGKRQATIQVSCLGQDGSTVTTSVTLKLVVPTLKCSSITPDSVALGWTGILVVNCSGNSVTSLNGVDFKGTMFTVAIEGETPTPFITNPTQFHNPNEYGIGVTTWGNGTFKAVRDIYLKNSERPEEPLKFRFVIL